MSVSQSGPHNLFHIDQRGAWPGANVAAMRGAFPDEEPVCWLPKNPLQHHMKMHGREHTGPAGSSGVAIA